MSGEGRQWAWDWKGAFCDVFLFGMIERIAKGKKLKVME